MTLLSTEKHFAVRIIELRLALAKAFPETAQLTISKHAYEELSRHMTEENVEQVLTEYYRRHPADKPKA